MSIQLLPRYFTSNETVERRSYKDTLTLYVELGYYSIRWKKENVLLDVCSMYMFTNAYYFSHNWPQNKIKSKQNDKIIKIKVHLFFVWNKCDINFSTRFHVFNNICFFEHLKNIIWYGWLNLTKKEIK